MRQVASFQDVACGSRVGAKCLATASIPQKQSVPSHSRARLVDHSPFLSHARGHAGRWAGRTRWAVAATTREGPLSLAELIAFESDATEAGQAHGPQAAVLPEPALPEDPTQRARAILDRAARALSAAQQVTGSSWSSATAAPAPDTDTSPSPGHASHAAGSSTREILHQALLRTPTTSAADSDRDAPGTAGSSSGSRDLRNSGTRGGGGASPSPWKSAGKAAGAGASTGTLPSWATAAPGQDAPSPGRLPADAPRPAMKRAPAAAGMPALLFEELPMQGFLQLRSQDEEEAAAALRAELPPLQSILELTTAHLAPGRLLEGVEDEEAAAALPQGRQLADGEGELADGTRWEKRSGQDLGPGGFWKKWTMLKGWTEDGSVAFEECWWESSDWAGLKELGATKSGHTATGSAWRETWCEKAFHNPDTLELMVERSAHKWARADSGDEWEEKWGEAHAALGKVSKFADKWGKEGGNVWHEKWGEEYDGQGGCHKYTDKWAERLLPGGAREQWGDKWTEGFGAGKGEKHGEVWSVAADGHRYNRWWNEGHFGDGRVRKWGDSTAGENWDSIEHMDTYYNPIPHFGFSHAVRHSQALWRVAERPRHMAGDRPSSPSTSGSAEAGSDASASSAPWDADDAALGGGLDMLDGSQDEAPAAAAASDPEDSVEALSRFLQSKAASPAPPPARGHTPQAARTPGPGSSSPAPAAGAAGAAGPPGSGSGSSTGRGAAAPAVEEVAVLSGSSLTLVAVAPVGGKAGAAAATPVDAVGQH